MSACLPQLCRTWLQQPISLQQHPECWGGSSMAEGREETGKKAKKGPHSFWLHSAGSLPKPLGVLNSGISLSGPRGPSKASSAKPTPAPSLHRLRVCCAESPNRVRLFATPWTVARQAPLSMGFFRQEYWSGCHALLQGIFPIQGSNPDLPHGRRILYCLSHQRSPYWYVRPHKAFIESSR